MPYPFDQLQALTPEQVAADMNIHDMPVNCDCCGWIGFISDLAVKGGLSCCPKCFNFDYRITNSLVNF